MIQLSRSVAESCLQSFLSFSASSNKSLPQVSYTWRHNHHKVRVWERFIKLYCSLHIYVKHRNSLRCHNVLYLLLTCAIKVSMNFTVFNKCVLINHCNEIFPLDKIVMNAIFFTWTWTSCSVRNTESKLTLIFLCQLCYQSALTYSAWTNNH